MQPRRTPGSNLALPDTWLANNRECGSQQAGLHKDNRWLALRGARGRGRRAWPTPLTCGGWLCAGRNQATLLRREDQLTLEVDAGLHWHEALLSPSADPNYMCDGVRPVVDCLFSGHVRSSDLFDPLVGVGADAVSLRDGELLRIG